VQLETPKTTRDGGFSKAIVTAWVHVNDQPQVYTVSIYLWLNNPVKKYQQSISQLKPISHTSISRLLANSFINESLGRQLLFSCSP